MVEVFIEREKRRIKEEFSGKISELLARLCINMETIIVVKNGAVVSEDEKCSNEDQLTLLSVISGG